MGRWMTVTACAAAFAVTAIAAPVAGAQVTTAMDGAPLNAEVRLQSTFGLPPEAYSFGCVPSLPACTNAGNIDLATTAEVPVAKRTGVTQGVAPLSYTLANGEVSRTFSCQGNEGGTFNSRFVLEGTQAGELEVSKVAAVPGANSLVVALNHGGDSGGEFPQEVAERTDGGCGSPQQTITQQMGQWYYHFYLAHRDEQQEVGNDLELQGLTFENGVFAKTYERFVTVGSGSNTYPAYEATRIEVEPDFCEGAQNRIVSATGNGQSLGLDGSSFYPGQVISGPPKTKIRLGDGSAIEMEQGGLYRMEECETNATKVFLGETVKSLIAKIKKAAAGSDAKFEVQTERAVVGVRGTVFDVSYNEPKELTRVSVDEGSVSLKGINGAKGKVIVEAGEVGIQKGTKAPKVKG